MNDHQFMERLNYFKKINSHTTYEFSKMSDIPFSTLYSMEQKYSMPSMHTFLSLCDGFKITPCEFFLQENDTILNISAENRAIIKDLLLLSQKNRSLVHEIIKICLQNQAL